MADDNMQGDSGDADKEAPPSPPLNIKGVRKSKGNLASTVCFTRGPLLGKGAFARCYELSHGEKQYAAKIIAKAALTKPNAKEKLIAEIKIHRTLKHVNVVEFSTFFEDDNWYYLVLELCNHKTLRSLVRRRKRLTEIEARYYLNQILDGVEYMHAQLIIHRDLKLDNIFLKDMVVKIGDLGLSTQLAQINEVKRSVCGTPNYIAPEVINKQGHSFPVDIWAIGIILYTLIIGKPPFETPEKNVEDTYKRIRHLDYSFPPEVEISAAAKDLIQKILVHDPDARPSINGIRAHEWFKGYVPVTLPHHALLHTPRWKERHLAFRRDDAENLLSSLNQNLFPASNPLQNGQAADPNSPTPQRALKRKAIEDPKSPPAQEGSAVKRRRLQPAPNKTPFQSPSLSTAKSEARVTGGYDGMRNESDNLADVPFGAEMTKFDILHQHLARILAPKDSFTGASLQPWIEQDDSMEPGPSHWIAKWIDYSEKYGLGYLLCNGSVGVIFNDGSKIVATPKFEYCDLILLRYVQVIKLIYPRSEDDMGDAGEERSLLIYGQDVETRFQNDAFVTKRVTLLRYFTTSLSNCFHSQGLEEERAFDGDLVFAKEWKRSNKAILFTLSNGITQVNFYDHAKIVVAAASAEAASETPWRKALTLKVTSITPQGERASHVLTLNTAPAQQNVHSTLARSRLLANPLGSVAYPPATSNPISMANPELHERLVYTRDCLAEYFLAERDSDL